MAQLELDDRGTIVICGRCGQKNRLLYGRLGGRVRCASCKSELWAPAAPLEVAASADFDRLIGNASIPVVVDYWAPWCGPCRMVAPEIQKVATRQAGRVLVVKVNTEALPDLGQRFNVRSIPTLAVFAQGKEVSRTTGARPATDIEAFIDQANVNERVLFPGLDGLSRWLTRYYWPKPVMSRSKRSPPRSSAERTERTPRKRPSRS